MPSITRLGGPVTKLATLSDVTATGARLGGSPVVSAVSGGIPTAFVVRPPTVIRPEDYGAVGDATADDGPAFSAAYTAASAVGGPGSPGVIRGIPGAIYRIATTVIVKPYVRVEQCHFGGSITGAARITASNNPAAPVADDVTGQTVGACFSDTGGSDVVAGLEWDSVHLTDFRYGFVSKGLAWAHPVWRDVFFENCNVGIFAYQGAQEYRLLNTASGGGAAGTTFVAAATCFPTGHPYASSDNYFCDGFLYDNAGHFRDASKKNPTFDAWFEAAILRPATNSVVAGGSYTFPFTGNAREVSGRNIYIPSRNRRSIFSVTINKSISQDCELGVAAIGNPMLGTVRNVSGESMFAAGPQPMVLVLLTGSPAFPHTAMFSNIDAEQVTNPASAGVEVRVGSNLSAASADFYAKQVTGGIIGTEYFGEYGPAAPAAGWRVGACSFIDPAYLPALTANNGTANRTHYYRVRDAATISKISITVGTASGNIAMAVYRNTGTGRSAKPGARIATTGSVTCPATGFDDVSLGGTVTVRNGDWLAFACDNTTATFAAWQNTGAIGASGMLNGRCGYEDTYPPPATANPTMGIQRGIAMIGN